MYHWPETSESLLVRLRDSQDAEAWSQFMALYEPVLYRLVRGKGLQTADAQDVCQQVFVSIVGAVERWEPRANGPPFRAWLQRIARNATLNALTRSRPDRGSGSSTVNEWLSQVVVADSTHDELRNELRLEAYRWAAGEVRTEFRTPTWEMFHETVIDGQTIEDVAARWGRSPGAVYIARCRVMQRLREKVNELSDFWSDLP